MAEYTEKEALIANIKNLPTCWADAGGVYGRSMKYPEGMFDCEDVISSVANAPAVDVAPVAHGHWIIGVDDDDFDVKCSKCEWTDIFEVAGIAAVERIAKTMHYCPNCGARMDGADND